jgi:hypothetical protein
MLQRNRPAPKTRPTPYSVLSGMTNRVPIPYSSGFPGHCFRTLGSKDGWPLICQKKHKQAKICQDREFTENYSRNGD